MPFRFFYLALLGLCIYAQTQADTTTSANPKPRLAIIIDDLGNNRLLGQRIIDLPAPITVAVLPHRPHGRLLATNAHAAGKEVMLHAPMANISNKSLGKGALTPEQNEQVFKQTLADGIQSIPYIKGMNNHMGSLLTQQDIQMQWVMDTLQGKDLFFVDSLTTASSVAWKKAGENKIPYAIRSVFLDNDKSAAALQRQFNRAIRKAKKNGQAILIGHPYKETSAFLQQALAQLEQENIEVVPASWLLTQPVIDAKQETYRRLEIGLRYRDLLSIN